MKIQKLFKLVLFLVLPLVLAEVIGVYLFNASKEGVNQFTYSQSEQLQPGALQSVHAQAMMTTTLSQHDITWTFDREYEYGQFINGDYWVIGPVVVTTISPAFDGTTNGSVIEPVGNEQGYDTRAANYVSTATVETPVTIEPDASLVSTIGRATFSRTGLDVAAVLTVLASPPPVDAFRPSYAQGPKLIFRLSDVHQEFLLNLAPPTDGLQTKLGQYQASRDLPTDAAELADRFQRVWLDHLTSEGGIYQNIRPLQNFMPGSDDVSDVYSRDTTNSIALSGMALLLEDIANRDILLRNLLQVGIDYYGVAMENDSLWHGADGQSNGRKWPIVFAGIMFDNAEMKELSYASGEEDQTYYYDDPGLPLVDYWGFQKRGVPAWTGAKVLWGSLNHRDGQWCRDYEHVDPQSWPQVRPGQYTDGCWSERYRYCCTSFTWVGQALSMHLLNATLYWDPAWFDYVDRWMTETYSAEELERLQDIPCGSGVTTLEERVDQRSSGNRFIDAMWHTYRAPLTVVCGDNHCEGPVESDITCPSDCGAGQSSLELYGMPADQAILLAWEVNPPSLPTTTTWRIDYYTSTIIPPLVVTDMDSTTRSYTLSNLTNYQRYTVTLHAMLGETSWLSDTIHVTPTNIAEYLPVILK